jgi:hypothetical protein
MLELLEKESCCLASHSNVTLFFGWTTTVAAGGALALLGCKVLAMYTVTLGCMICYHGGHLYGIAAGLLSIIV